MSQWSDICNIDEILPNMGRCALFDGEQVAIFRVSGAEDRFYAINNFCPFAEANVLSRGLVGSVGEAVVVASPIYKQHFNLATGECIEEGDVKLKTYSIRLEGNTIQLAA